MSPLDIHPLSVCTQSLWLKCLARVPGEGLRGSVHWLVVLISNYKRGLDSLGQTLLITQVMHAPMPASSQD